MVREILIIEFGDELGKYFTIVGCCTSPMCPVNCAH
jgi:hypothetical protein